MATPANGNAPKARNVPERADTGAVDPSDYTPTPKAAPEPANDAPGIVAADASTEAPLPEISDSQRKPYKRNAPVADTVRAVKSGVEKARSVVERAAKAIEGNGKPVNNVELLKKIADKDKRRMRAVSKYRPVSRMMFNPLIRARLISKGVENATEAQVEAIYLAVSGLKVFAGAAVTAKGHLKARSLPATDLFPYIFGGAADKGFNKVAEQSINHPVLFDFFVVGGALANVLVSSMSGDSAIGKAIDAAIASQQKQGQPPQEPIKAEARVSDPPTEGNE